MNLFYREYGTGDKYLIILHGLFGMSDNWVGLAKKFAETHHIIIPDLRNHGLSPHSSDFSISLILEDLDTLFLKLGIVNPVLLGHSLGGRIAMNYCLENEGKVPKLIVADMSLKAGKLRPEHEAIMGAINSIELSKMHSISDIETELFKTISNTRRVQFVLKNIKRIETGYGWKLNFKSLINHIPDIMPELKSNNRYESPSLFIRGGASDYILKEDEAAIFKHFPNANIETIEGASHWLHADNPQKFVKLVTDFL
ncbi:MAG: alpha/beta hydrolase [Bacteroidetes bacterium]|nr:MAG: alpha/beta hydrolase [Bacteroidota bacterium]